MIDWALRRSALVKCALASVTLIGLLAAADAALAAWRAHLGAAVLASLQQLIGF